QGAELTGGEDRLHVRPAAGFAKRRHLVVESRPIAGENVGARDHYVDLGGTGGHRLPDFLDLDGQGRLSRREAGGYRGHRDSGSCQGLDGYRHQVVVNTDGADLQVELSGAERLQDLLAHGAAGLRTKAPDVAGSSVAGQ